MKNQLLTKIVLLIGFMLVAIGIACAQGEKNTVAGVAFSTAAILLYVGMFALTKLVLNIPGILSLFWLGGIGVASFKLSHLSSKWENETWIALIGFYAVFIATYFLVDKIKTKTTYHNQTEISNEKLFKSIIILTTITTLAFLAEVFILGYIPIATKNTPHAYSYFHVTGIHYFTVSTVFIIPLAYLYRKKTKENTITIFLCCLLSILIPIMCVSRFFVMVTIILTMFVVIHEQKQINAKKTFLIIGIALIILVPLYVLVTYFRSHSVAYLNEIFEMKNQNIPIFITQPYMYIANNFENLNCLVRDCTSLLHGRRMLFPFFALTGLKFIFPESFLVTETIYITKKELTTLTLIYDSYFDFGVVGVLVFGVLLGGVGAFLTKKMLHTQNPFAKLLYLQFVVYMMLSFFTTWFSNPTTWFWFVLTIAGWIYTSPIRLKERT